MRGNQWTSWKPLRLGNQWSIPAHAGEPPVPGIFEVEVKGSIPAHAGEPGNANSLTGGLGRRSIPAHAGEPVRDGISPMYCRAGLSPRMRGNHPRDV